MALADVPSNQRIQGIDATRGAAMVFVCLSHFTNTAFRLDSASPVRHILMQLAMVASPTFMLISGMMIGLLYETRRASFGSIARTFTGRGIFLLTVAHVLILLAVMSFYDSPGAALRLTFITDVIGVAVLAGPFLMRRLGVRGRLYLGLALMFASVMMSVLWIPVTAIGAAFRYLLAGPWDPRMPGNFAMLPWLAVYLFGSALGEWVARLFMSGRYRAVEFALIGLGAVAVCAALLANIGHEMIGGPRAWAWATSPTQKFPPSPAYLAFFGGCGLIMTGCVLMAQRWPVPTFMRWLRLLGRTSLFVFILQFYVFYVGFSYVPDVFLQFWPVLFIVSLTFITVCAWIWDKAGGNRWYNTLDWFSQTDSRRRTPLEAGAVAVGKA